MGDLEESTAAIRLAKLEATLHIERRHPDYEYTHLTIVGEKDVYTAVQFSLVDGWEINYELQEMQGINVRYTDTSDQEVEKTTMFHYLRRLKKT